MGRWESISTHKRYLHCTHLDTQKVVVFTAIEVLWDFATRTLLHLFHTGTGIAGTAACNRQYSTNAIRRGTTIAAFACLPFRTARRTAPPFYVWVDRFNGIRAGQFSAIIQGIHDDPTTYQVFCNLNNKPWDGRLARTRGNAIGVRAQPLPATGVSHQSRALPPVFVNPPAPLVLRFEKSW